MKYEIKNAEMACIRTLVFFIFYIGVIFFILFSLNIGLLTDNQIFNRIIGLLCYPVLSEYDLIDKNLYVFNSCYFLLYLSMFYIFDFIYAHNNIATRFNSKKWLIYKYVIGIISIIILSLIEYACIFYVLNNNMPLNIKYYLYPIVFRILIMTYVYSIFNLFRTNILLGIISLPLAVYSLYKFNIIFAIVVIIGLFIFNYLFFNLRQFRYNIFTHSSN
jgi:hypothetical protein